MEALFGRQGHIDVSQECARAVLVFAYGLVLVRLAGRRVFGKWAALDIIVSLVVGGALARAMTGGAPLLGTLLATTLLMVMHFLLSQVAARRPGFAHLLEGRHIELAKDGRLELGRLHRQGVTDGDIHEALRSAGVDRLEETRLIALEPSGKITVLKPK